MSRLKQPIGHARRILDLLQGVKRSGTGWTAVCPSHKDRISSLSIAEGDDGRVLLKCFAGCDASEIVAAIGLKVSDLFPGGPTKPTHPSGGLTLQEYASAKGLPVEFLRKLGLDTIYLQGTPAVRMPYMNADGIALCTRMRLSMNNECRFRWKVGSKPVLYGLSRLRTSKSKYICLVEGESDCQTLWWNRFPALGLPGATTWNEDWAEHLARFERIYILLEPDRGGEAVLKWLEGSTIRDRARLIKLQDTKDASELYLSNPRQFTNAWKTAMRIAVPWIDAEVAEKESKRRTAWRKCKKLARKDDILSDFVEELEQRGVVGETRAAKLLYLALTSRVLKRPVSAVVTGPSSAGKSFIVERTLNFFPPTAYYDLTAMSERALIYSAEPLIHRFLVLYEVSTMSDFLNYIIRSLLSEARIRYETVEKTKNGMQPRLIERPGPTGLLMTTTAVRLHPENETRQFAIPVSDTPAHTRRILQTIASAHDGSASSNESTERLDPWRALQVWVDYANHRVVVPYADALANLIPPVAVRLRRDFTAILNLIEAHAILHQVNRRSDKNGCIIARIADYRAVRRLVNNIVSEGIEQTVPATVRQTVKAVAEICSENAISEHSSGERDDPNAATILQVAKKLRLDRSSASRRVKQALTRGHLRNLETKRGRPQRLVIGDPLSEEAHVMPTPKEVLQQWKATRS